MAQQFIQPDEAKYLKRRIKGGSIDAHPTEKALIVHYEVEATILGEFGNPMIGERKESQKIIKLKTLNQNTDISTLAKEVVEKCKLIHPTKLLEVEQLLYYLQNRKENNLVSSSNNKKKVLSDKLEDPNIDDINETANINELDSYAEMLYEDDLNVKIRGSGLILQLARNPDNLDELYQNESILNLLSRVIKEDWKKSIELSTNIIYIFFCFSSFSQFHPLVAHYKIGAQTVQIIDNELSRYDTWQMEIAKRKRIAEEDKSNEAAAREYERVVKSSQKLINKQEQLLRVAFYLLLNLAEDIKVEIKMVNKEIVRLLVKTLERSNPELLILVVSFLKKLSIFIENKNEMKEQKAVINLAKLVPCEQEDLLNITLRLLLNLSFDSTIRSQIIKTGLLAKLVNLLANENQRVVSLCLLYQLSMDEKAKKIFTFTDCIPLLMKMIIEAPSEHVDLELVALGINLGMNSGCAVAMAKFSKNKGLKTLIKRAFKFKDPLVMKMIRNMSQHDEIKSMFCDYLALLGETIVTETNEDFLIEVVGTLGNLNIPEIDYKLVIEEYNLVEWIKSRLRSESTDDDLILDIIVLVGTLCNDDECANILSKSNIIKDLIDLLNAKQEDDEIVLQIVYVFYQMIFHKSTREIIIKKTEAPAYLIDLMHDKNTEVRKVCDLTLDTISEYDEEWARKIQIEKFRWHNSQWLDMIESNQDSMPNHNDLMDEYGLYNNDEPLDAYMTVQDADLLDERNPNDYYYPEGYQIDGYLSPESTDFEYSDFPTDRDMKSRIGYNKQNSNGPQYYIDSYGRPVEYYPESNIHDADTLDYN